MERVGVGLRFLAYFCDSVFLGIIVLLIKWVYPFMTGGHQFGRPAGMSRLEYFQHPGVSGYFMLLCPLLYYATEILFARTPGKLLVGICVGDENGARAGVLNLSMRWLLKNSQYLLAVIAVIFSSVGIAALSGLASLLVCIGMLLAFGEARQALHDKFALTAVYHGRPGDAGKPIEARPRPMRPESQAVDQLIFK